MKMKKDPKVTVIGAASYFFGKSVINKMATSQIMDRGTPALVDVDIESHITQENQEQTQ